MLSNDHVRKLQNNCKEQRAGSKRMIVDDYALHMHKNYITAGMRRNR